MNRLSREGIPNNLLHDSQWVPEQENMLMYRGNIIPESILCPLFICGITVEGPLNKINNNYYTL